MIEMEQIKKSFALGDKQVEILKGISLFIGKGEFVSIMGPSGSGKSTLSSILGCLASSTSGKYRIDGRDVGTLSTSDLAALRNAKIGFIFQDFNLLEGLTAAENVSLPLLYAGISAKERKDRSLESLKKVGLEAKAFHTPSQLSGGQKQRVAIARALVANPSFLFADEPTGALDKKTGFEILGLMQKLNALGHTIVQVTHSLYDAGFSKRILHLVDGTIIRDEIVERPNIGYLSTSEQKGNEISDRLWRVAKGVVPNADDLASLKKLLATSASESSLIEAVGTLSRFNTPEAKEMILALSKHEHWGVRAEVLRTLGTDLEHQLALLFQGLEDKNAWVRFTAVLSIKKVKKSDLSEEKIARIIACLKDEDERVRATTVALMGFWKDPKYDSIFINALDDADGRVRANALDALGPLFLSGKMDSKIIEKCKPLLSDRHNRVRANAAVYLFGYAETECFETLKKMFFSENNLVRSSSAWALGKVPHPDAGTLLLEAIKSETEEIVLGQIYRSLGELAKGRLPLKQQISQTLGGAEPEQSQLQKAA